MHPLKKGLLHQTFIFSYKFRDLCDCKKDLQSAPIEGIYNRHNHIKKMVLRKSIAIFVD